MKPERTLNLLKRRLKLLLSISEKGEEKTKLEAEAAADIDGGFFQSSLSIQSATLSGIVQFEKFLKAVYLKSRRQMLSI